MIDKTELKKIVPFSSSYIAKLEKAGKFPRRVRLGPCRVGWLHHEVIEWIHERVSAREAA